MKKILPIILILISLILFGWLIYIAIYAKDLSDFLASIGFIAIGYIAIIMFAFAWFKLKKN